MASLASSSSVVLQTKYDVFLSFRGEDTRDNFTSHLYAALCQKKIQTFIDYNGLKRGDEISPVLLKAIEESNISIIIFSKDYAFSSWCLDELAKILECKEKNGQMVVPVFYHVNPLDVRKQTGSFGDAFVKHEERFKEMTGKVKKWRDALTTAANLSGWDSMMIRPESKLVNKIVEDILKKLNDISPASSDCEGLVGIDSSVEHIKSLLCIGLSDFRTVGIWGMGGIGKTTIAEVVFNQICGEFEGCCFIRNVREESTKCGGLVRLKEQILSKLLEEENLNVGTLNTIPISIKRRVQCKKVFIVLDDVSDSEQLRVLSGGLVGLGSGSRVIITTRDKQVLCAYGVEIIYQVTELNNHEALQLFCNYAFKQDPPLDELMVLVEKIIDYAKGNPLALKVLGSSLYGKSKQNWESALQKLNKTLNREIYNVLRISYDGLDYEEQNIFLDITCFFKGEDRDHVIKILDNCYHSLLFGLSVLIDKSLITISYNNTLQMHDLLQDMGWEIVHQEDFKNPGKRSRLWYPEDIYRILKNNKGTDSIEGIFLNMSKIRDLPLSSRAFAKMSSLRLLKFYEPHCNELDKKLMDISKVHFPRGLKCLPDELRYLHWDGYPFRTLPSKFSLENLVQLELPYSHVEQLWKGTKHPTKLKFIDLYHSQCLTEIPDLSDAIGLEGINLEYCTSLVGIHLSVQSLDSLRHLHLKGCVNLKAFPSNIHFRSLITLDLSDCINLTEFPQISGNIIQLHLCGTAIEEVPLSIACLTKLVILNMKNCKRLKRLPTSICKLKSLRWLILWDCSKLESFPEILENMERLEYLTLNGATSIIELPPSIEYVKGLVNLGLRDCLNLVTIPSSICNLTSLSHVDISGCSKLEKLPQNLGNLIFLGELEASRTAVSELPSSISCWKRTSHLNLAFCKLSKIPESLCCVSSLVVLDLSGNNFENLPADIKQLSLLEELYLSSCDMLQSLPELPLHLNDLEAINCEQLHSLPQLASSQEEVDASELKVLSGHHSPLARTRINFTFINCHNLNTNGNNILEDAPLRFQHMATASLRYAHDEVDKETPAITFCLPGSEIPDWVNYQNLGSSLTIELPQHWCHENFIGFALCVVVSFKRSYNGSYLGVPCDYSFETTNGDRVDFECWLNAAPYRNRDVLIDSDHVLIGYDPCFNVRLLNGDYRTASFEFTLDEMIYPNILEICEVKCCGVCPLYTPLKDAKPSISTDKLATTSQDFGATVDHTDTNGSQSGASDEEAEPQPKRLRKTQINAS